ncbi:MAG: hypothetical protein IT306_00260 [Chloroflexi bacterium]|nr:hypothetical protein [Chloroflexota bacterium]
MTIEISTTDKRDGKALALFARCAEWQTGHTKDGRAFFAIPGSDPGLLHMTDQRDCSCQDRQRSRNVCKHMRAVRLWMAAFATGAVAPKPRPATPAVTDDAGIGDELVILTPEGAALLAEAKDQTDSATTRYAKLYPTCRVKGCQDDPEPRSLDCYRHQLVDAF